MSEVSTWSAVDASNTATPPDGWPEGMQPSAVNDSARMMMGALRREHDNIVAQIGSVAGTISTTTINATTINTTGAITASGPITGSAINSTGNASVAGTLTAGAVSVGFGTVTAGNINASGTVTTGNINASGTVTTGNISASGTIGAGGMISAGGFTTAGVIYAGTNFNGPLGHFTNATIDVAVNTPYLYGGTGAAGTLQMYGTSNKINFRYDTLTAGQVAWRVDNSLERFISSTVNVFNTYYNTAGGPTGWAFYGEDIGRTVYITFVDGFSDERIKDNIAETEVDALTVLQQVPVSQFDVKGPVAAWLRNVEMDLPERIASMQGAQPVHVPIGFVAQRIQSHLPDAVTVVPQDNAIPEAPFPVDTMSINKSEFIPYLVRAIQQLAARVEVLEARGDTHV